MSLQRVQEFCATVPTLVAEQVIGYARSVEEVLPEVFEELDAQFSPEIAGDVVFLSGVKKLRSILRFSLISVDAALGRLEDAEFGAVRIGSVRYSRSSRDYLDLRRTCTELDDFLDSEGIGGLMAVSLSEMILFLQHGPR